MIGYWWKDALDRSPKVASAPLSEVVDLAPLLRWNCLVSWFAADASPVVKLCIAFGLVDSVEVVVRSSEPSENGAVLCFFGTTTVPSDSRRMGISLSEPPPPSEGARDSGLKSCW